MRNAPVLGWAQEVGSHTHPMCTVWLTLYGRLEQNCIAGQRARGYTKAVNKTTIEFDPVKRDAVAAVLGTKGLKATVDAAFDAVLRQHAGRELVRMAQEGGIELTNEEVESRAWGD